MVIAEPSKGYLCVKKIVAALYAKVLQIARRDYYHKGLEYGKRLSAKDVLRTFKARTVLPSISLLEKTTQKT